MTRSLNAKEDHLVLHIILYNKIIKGESKEVELKA